MDANNYTREEFTQSMLSRPIPSTWPADVKERTQVLKSLLDKLAHNSAMRTNLNQTFMTPANSKNRVYFMWDFVGRTLGYAFSLPANPDLSNARTTDSETWSDVVGRSVMAAELILNTNPGMLNMMIESAYGGQNEEAPSFGDETLDEAEKLKSLT